MNRRPMRLILALCGLAVQGGCCLVRPSAPSAPAWSAAAEEAVIEALEEACAAGRALEDYTCRFDRHERVNGWLGTKQQMDVKFRCRPFSLYMRWVDPAKMGAELLYVAGRYGDQAFARQGGALGWLLRTIRLRLDDPLITKRSRHAVTDFGLESAAALVLRSVRAARQAGGLQARGLPDGEVRGEPARGFEVLLPDQPDSYARRIGLWFDPERKWLKRIAAYNEAGELLEDYAFTRVRANVGLTDADFDPSNPAYGFYRWGSGG